MVKSKNIIYLSGAPRISTSPDSENTAALNHILQVCLAFERMGYTVSKYILGDLLPKRMTGKGSENLANKSFINRILTDIFRMLIILSNRRKALKFYRSDLDFVYERFALMQSVGWVFKKKGVPWILETNAILSEEAFYESKTLYFKWLSEFLEKWAYEKCDLLVTISENLKQAIVSKYGIDENKIYVMQNGVNISMFAASESQSSSAEFVIGYVGSLIKWQSLELLLTAVSELKDQLKDLKVIIVGDGTELPHLKRLAYSLKINDFIEFKGRVEPNKVPEMIKSFSLGYCNPCHVSSTTSEVFNSPMKLYEYLAMGKPVIAQDNYDLKRLLGSDKYLYAMKGYEVENVKKGILHFYQQKDDLNIIGKLAVSEIRRSHSWDHRVKNMLDYFKDGR